VQGVWFLWQSLSQWQASAAAAACNTEGQARWRLQEYKSRYSELKCFEFSLAVDVQ